MFALVSVLPLAAQTEANDTAQFVVVYDYECRTQDRKGEDVTDKMQVAVQVGRLLTKSMPFSDYMKSTGSEEAYIELAYEEALMHMPTVWVGLPAGHTTVREYIFPNTYEGSEKTPEIAWTLTDDTITVSGFLCQKATATFRGVEWHVCYTDEVPSSAGPWRLGGLPGLIVRAESDAHTFCLSELRQESSPITKPDDNPEVYRLKYAKLLKYRNEIYGNSQYAGNPMYHVADKSGNAQSGYTLSLGGAISHMDVLNFGGKQYIYANGHPFLTTAHVFQPLEKNTKI